MSAATKIEWCDSTFNPWIGCTKISPACDNCYAETRMDKRLHVAQWGAGNPRVRTSEKNWCEPIKWNKAPFYKCSDCDWRGETDSNCPNCAAEVRVTRRRVFCASLADVFDNEVDPQWRADLFRLIENTPNLDWLLLTKRIGNAADMIFAACGGYLPLLNNIWIGATICNQEEADRDIPKLLAAPARVRFLSIEPLLSPITLPRVDFHCSLCGGTGILARWPRGQCHVCKGLGEIPAISIDPKFGMGDTPMRHIDWVIVGGESGKNARPMHPQWVRDIRDQCTSAGVPFLFKQWGEWAPGTSDGEIMAMIGKKTAGRLLDGVEWNQFPESAA